MLDEHVMEQRRIDQERRRSREIKGRGEVLARVRQLSGYEAMDAAMLGWAEGAGDFSFEDGRTAGDSRSELRDAGSYWLESAALRGLIDAHHDDAHDGRSYTLSGRGLGWLAGTL